MIRLQFILVLWIELAFSLPATRMNLVSYKNTSQDIPTKFAVGTTYTDEVEVTLPLKITNKEELITWITYAMRIMASRINITLEAPDPEMPSDKIEKLRNSSIIINHLIEKINNAEHKNPESIKPFKIVTFSSLKNAKNLENMRIGTNSNNMEEQLLKQTITTELPTGAVEYTPNNFEMITRPESKNDDNFFSKNESYNSLIKEDMQGLVLMNPYDHPDNKIFRDPDIFPPFTIEQRQNAYLPLPLKSTFTRKDMEKLNAMSKISDESEKPLNIKKDPLGSLQHVPINNKQNHLLTVTRYEIGTKTNELRSDDVGITYKQQKTELPLPSRRPVIRVPFEAYITITQDAPEKLHREIRNFNGYNQKYNQNGDNHYDSSISDSDIMPSSLPQSNINKTAQRENVTSKTSANIEESSITSLPMEKRKRKEKKEKSNNVRYNFSKDIILRMLSFISRNTTSPIFANMLSKISKKLPNLKDVQVHHRSKINATSQKQEDDINNINNKIGGNNGDGKKAKQVNDDDKRDIFDDDIVNDYDNDYDDDKGSLGSLEDLLPLVIPVLEDISNPESDTDFGEILAAVVPLLQSLSEQNPETGEKPDIIGVLGPILRSLSTGKDGQGSDSGAILGPIIQLVAPFIGPLLGPLSGPLSSSSSGGGGKGSSLGSLLTALLGPLSQPTEPGGQSPIAGVVATIVSLLSAELSSPNSGVDLGALVSQIVTGALSGSSAGLSGGSSKGSSKDPQESNLSSEGYGLPSQVEILAPPLEQQISQLLMNMKQSNKSQKGVSSRKKSRFQTQDTRYKPQATHAEVVQFPQHNKVVQLIPEYPYEQIAAPANGGSYGTYGVPANKVKTFELLGKAFKEILSSGVNLVKAILGTSTAASGASSASSDNSNPVYGPPPSSQSYGKPYLKQDSYQNIQ